jgi:uncharacterized membrane protein
MSGAELALAVSVFLACAVEAVEALTIVLAVGTARDWRSTMIGVGAATAALAAAIAALGGALSALPLDLLRLVLGGLLLTFGLQWLRKAILRSAGVKARHDELDAFEQEVAAARAAGGRAVGFDGYSFSVAFKGVLLEGLEVAFIVLTFGAGQRHIGVAAAAAGAAVLLVVLAGWSARAPLARVPENTMKLAVGVMLSSFGMFWGAEGAGAHWPAGDASLLVIVPAVLLAAVTLASMAASRASSGEEEATRGEATGPSVEVARAARASAATRGASAATRAASAVAGAAWEFVVGEDWQTALVVTLALALTALLAAAGAPAWWTTPAAVLAALAVSVRSATRIALGASSKCDPR